MVGDLFPGYVNLGLKWRSNNDVYHQISVILFLHGPGGIPNIRSYYKLYCSGVC